MYLLDTNVLSELRKPRRNPNVVNWISAVPPHGLHLSVITIGEIAKGIGKQRRAGTPATTAHADALQSWLDGLLADQALEPLPSAYFGSPRLTINATLHILSL